MSLQHMRKSVLYILFAVLLSFCGCSSDKGKATVACGGWSDFRKPTQQEKELFHALTDTVPSMKYRPVRVSVQTVAGCNLRFRCKPLDDDSWFGGRKVYITIFEPLPCNGGVPQITAIETQTRSW